MDLRSLIPLLNEPLLLGQILVSLVVAGVMVHVILLTVAYLIYLERKISAYIQDRLGPNRVGFDFGIPQLKFLRGALGLGQPLADGLKFLLKEDYAPRNVDKILFTLAPIAIIAPALIGFLVIPWGGVWMMPEFEILGVAVGGGPVVIAGAAVNIGIVYLLAVAAVGVYGVAIGGWASNSKYSFLGGLRATAQMISYEIPLGLSLLAALLVVGSIIPTQIVQYQVQHGWLIIAQPLTATVFFIAILAEANRAPFDNAEAEQELVGGYHTEYSSMRFALFFLAEYAHMITSCAFFTLLFLGGYHLPIGWIVGEGHWFSPEAVGLGAAVAKTVVFFGKVVLLICFQMVIRWTLPRLRYDQVMMLGWQTLIPLGLAIVVTISVMQYLGLTAWYWLLLASILLTAALFFVQGVIRPESGNHRVPLHGSRFSPIPGSRVVTQSQEPLALEDHPIRSTAFGTGAGSAAPELGSPRTA